jgi:hypothetical protein
MTRITISGTAAHGHTLTASIAVADASGMGPVSYQWKANGVAIAGATGSSYIITASDTGKTIAVTASYTDGSGYAESVTSAGVSTPTLYLDFVSGIYADSDSMESLSSIITVSRSTTAGRINASGQYELVAANQPRIDYDPVTLQPRGLLIEEQRTNLLLHSNAVSNAVWSRLSVVVDSAAVAGASMAVGWKLSETTAATSHSVAQSVTPTSGTPYTFSVTLKSAERGFAFFGLNGGGITQFWSINLQTGSVSRVAGSTSTVRITPAGGGAWRVSVTATTASTAVLAVDVRVSYDGVWANRVYAGVDGSGIYMWDAQLEAGAFATSYIPTSSAQETRAADSITRAVGAWYSAAAGSLLADWLSQQYSTIPAPAVFTIAAGGNNGLSANGSARWWNGASSLATANSSPVGTIRRDAASWSTSSRSVCLLGGTVASDSAAGINGTPTVLRIGSASASSQYVNGHIRRVAYWSQQIDIQGATA